VKNGQETDIRINEQGANRDSQRLISAVRETKPVGS
jgi:hypothetical protein